MKTSLFQTLADVLWPGGSFLVIAFMLRGFVPKAPDKFQTSGLLATPPKRQPTTTVVRQQQQIIAKHTRKERIKRSLEAPVISAAPQIHRSGNRNH